MIPKKALLAAAVSLVVDQQQHLAAAAAAGAVVYRTGFFRTLPFDYEKTIIIFFYLL